MKLTGRYIVTRTPVDLPETLSDGALVSVPSGFDVPGHLLNVEYADPKGRFELLHGREWQVVGQPQGHLVLRLMDRGDFVAQATITRWTPAAVGKHLTEDEFKTAMNNTPGWVIERELQSSQVPSGDGRWIYRFSTMGQMDGVALMQNFYLVASPDGEQVVVAVTLTPKKAEQLGSRDVSLVSNLTFPKK